MDLCLAACRPFQTEAAIKCEQAEDLLARGLLQAAWQLCVEAESLDPSSSRPPAVLRAILIDAGLYEKARYASELALKRNPRDTLALTDLGIALLNLGGETDDLALYTMAEARTRECLKLVKVGDECLAQIHYTLGLCLLNQLREAEAEDSFNTALAMNPAHPWRATLSRGRAPTYGPIS
jgi:tetratricopeptide (TPR) repeat protein